MDRKTNSRSKQVQRLHGRATSAFAIRPCFKFIASSNSIEFWRKTRGAVLPFFLGVGLFGVGLETQPAAAQEGSPVLNATGRFLGYGWSRRGYHAPGGQMSVVRSRHPASNYPTSQSLQFPYDPNYRPTRPTTHPTALPSVQTFPSQPLNVVPSHPIQPTTPPPQWLKRYLDSQTSENPAPVYDSQPEPEPEPIPPPKPLPKVDPELLLEEPSPSDKANDLLRPKSLDERINAELGSPQGEPQDALLDDELLPPSDNQPSRGNAFDDSLLEDNGLLETPPSRAEDDSLLMPDEPARSQQNDGLLDDEDDLLLLDEITKLPTSRLPRTSPQSIRIATQIIPVAHTFPVTSPSQSGQPRK